MKYRKKHTVIEAFCLGVDDMPGWFCDKVTANEITTHGKYDNIIYCVIDMLEGVIRVNKGNYIIHEVSGEIYPCKPNIFEQTYEPAE